MKFLEKNLEDIIYDSCLTKEGRSILKERGLDIKGKLFRQVNLGGYGRIDLLECRFEKQPFGGLAPEITIYELKRNVVGVEALMQALRYEKGIKRYIEEFVPSRKPKRISFNDISIKLIGDSFMNENDFPFLYNKLNNVDAYIFSYGIDGIHFKRVDKSWKIKDGEERFDYELAESIVSPSFTQLRNILEPNRIEMPF